MEIEDPKGERFWVPNDEEKEMRGLEKDTPLVDRIVIDFQHSSIAEEAPADEAMEDAKLNEPPINNIEKESLEKK